ncbi:MULTISPECIES: hypothetical protein [unclassified Acidisoma]|nr:MULTISPECIES: hypothetical protein [unclassified Acidisoma]
MTTRLDTTAASSIKAAGLLDLGTVATDAALPDVNKATGNAA